MNSPFSSATGQPNAAISGWGSYCPKQVLTNKDLEQMLDTSDEWIYSRTGIRQRHIAAPDETTASMCIAAGQALEQADLAAADLDLVICATCTPDHAIPGTGCLIQHGLGAHRAAAFDVNTACTGFLTALTIGTQFIRCGTYRRVLVVAGETLSRFLDWKDRGTCVLFGDGAAAVILEATSQPAGVVSTILGSQGDTAGLITIEAGGSARPASAETVATGGHFVRLRGAEVFKQAVQGMTRAATDALASTGLGVRDIHKIIPHQANLRIVTAVQEALAAQSDQVFVNLAHHGNTGECSIPLALAEMQSIEPLRAGEDVLLVAFGGGLTWAAAVVRWADVVALRQERTKPATATDDDIFDCNCRPPPTATRNRTDRMPRTAFEVRRWGDAVSTTRRW